MVAHVSANKATPEQVVAATLAALEAGEEEVVPDEAAARVKAAMHDDPAALEAQAQRIWDEGLLPAKA